MAALRETSRGAVGVSMPVRFLRDEKCFRLKGGRGCCDELGDLVTLTGFEVDVERMPLNLLFTEPKMPPRDFFVLDPRESAEAWGDKEEPCVLRLFPEDCQSSSARPIRSAIVLLDDGKG